MPNIQYVRVDHVDGSAQPDPGAIDLINPDHVVWYCSVPNGRVVAVNFAPGNSPFTSLYHDGDVVIGSGNVGGGGNPPTQHPYEVVIESTLGPASGTGVVLNGVADSPPWGHTVHCTTTAGPPQQTVCVEVND